MFTYLTYCSVRVFSDCFIRCSQYSNHIGYFQVHFTDNRYYRYGYISTDTDTDINIITSLVMHEGQLSLT